MNEASVCVLGGRWVHIARDGVLVESPYALLSTITVAESAVSAAVWRVIVPAALPGVPVLPGLPRAVMDPVKSLNAAVAPVSLTRMRPPEPEP